MGDSFESAVHDAVRTLAETIYAEHGVMIDTIEIDWKNLPVEIGRKMRHAVLCTQVMTSKEDR